MKVILFLASRSRYHIPKIGAFVLAPQFAPFTSGFRPFVYQGKAFGEGEIDEANEAARRSMDTPIPNLGYQVTARFISDADYAAIGQEVVDEPPAPSSDSSTPGAEDSPEIQVVVDDNMTPPDYSPYKLLGKGIFYQGARVASLAGDDRQLRVMNDYADHRPAIEAWLQSQPSE